MRSSLSVRGKLKAGSAFGVTLQTLWQVYVESVDFLDAKVAEHKRGTIGSHARPANPIPRYPLWNLESRDALSLAVSDTNTIDDRSVPVCKVGDVHKFAVA